MELMSLIPGAFLTVGREEATAEIGRWREREREREREGERGRERERERADNFALTREQLCHHLLHMQQLHCQNWSTGVVA